MTHKAMFVFNQRELKKLPLAPRICKGPIHNNIILPKKSLGHGKEANKIKLLPRLSCRLYLTHFNLQDFLEYENRLLI